MICPIDLYLREITTKVFSFPSRDRSAERYQDLFKFYLDESLFSGKQKEERKRCLVQPPP
jgi:hypothetical protein